MITNYFLLKIDFKPLCYTKVKEMNNLSNYFSIGETAKSVNVTKETLRHYDRIGLIKPSKKDEFTNYRYYTAQDIVRIQTIKALQTMDLPLQEIKTVLEYDNLEEIVQFLEMAEKKAEEKIADLQFSKSKIQLAKSDYKKKLKNNKDVDGFFLKDISERTILLSDYLETPTVDNLWDYLRHFYNQIPSSMQENFSFEDLAGVYKENNKSSLFALCKKYANIQGLKKLPSGTYLCIHCKEEEKVIATNNLIKKAKEQYEIELQFIVEVIVVSGILNWKYEIQLLIK